MKLIHCADLHLDSPLESNLPPEKVKERRAEILAAFSGLVERAEAAKVSAILIAGDLFDSDRSTKRTEQYVTDLIRTHSGIHFFYLAGNHDRGNRLRVGEDRPDNLHMFGEEWTSYDLGPVTVTGSECPDPETLSLDPKRINLVLLHGQARSLGSRSADAEIIPMKKYKGRHIDYMALGHIHDYREATVDARCTAVYSGCLEGRGFDECGEHGYVLLEVDAMGRLSHTFVPSARRRLHTVECDLTGSASQLETEERILAAIHAIPSTDLVKVILCGSVAPDAKGDPSVLASVLSPRFWFVKVKDGSRLLIHPEEYSHDVSLKGEFVRLVMASNLSETEKERVIACGFRALAGEETGY